MPDYVQPKRAVCIEKTFKKFLWSTAARVQILRRL